jgi:hypothetical protein
MKTGYHQHETSGSILIVALLMALIIGFTLGGYLLWVGSQNRLTRESHAWNAALVVAEAGIEEGMAQVNAKFGSTNSNLAANDWEQGPTNGFYRPKQLPRVLVSGSATNGTYDVCVTRHPTNGFPIVYATGYTMVPLIGKLISRTIEVRTTKFPLFLGGMAAQSNITFKGNTIAIDSYDSMDPNHSTTNGMYDWAKRKASGDVASKWGLIDVGNATVNGKIKTGPESPNPTLGPNGWAGDLNWTGPGIQPTWYQKDFNADFRDAELPDNFNPLQPASITGSSNMYILGTGDYWISSLSMQNKNDNIRVVGNVRLHVLGDVSMSSQPAIYIEDGARLEIYVSGAKAEFGRVNTTGNANTFKYFGLPTNTSLSWNGNDQYVGTVYAPQANFTLGGGGVNELDYQGAGVTKIITLNGKFKFHFDEALTRGGPISGYVANSWREL